jgi:hypothetical protein
MKNKVHLNCIKFIIILSISFLTFVFNMEAQTLCPPNSGNMSSSSTTFLNGRYSPDSYVNYQYGSYNGEFQVIMDWNSLQNNSDYIEDATMKKFLEKNAVKNVVPQIPGSYTCDVSVYFTSICYAKVKIAIELDKNTQIACCSPNMNVADKIKSKYKNNEEHFYYNYEQKIPCGTKCCKRLYHCERKENPYDHTWYTEVSSPITLTVSTCSGPTVFIDCITGEPIQCDISEECGW